MTDVRPPCPVCGAEGGNCGPLDGSPGKPDHVQFAEWGRDDRPVIIKKEIIMANAVIATARIFEEVPIPRSGRTRKVLRYTPGHAVPEADVARLNVKADGTQSKVPTVDADVSGAVPLAAKKATTKTAKKATKAATKTAKTTTKRTPAKKKGTAKRAAARKRA